MRCTLHKLLEDLENNVGRRMPEIELTDMVRKVAQSAKVLGHQATSFWVGDVLAYREHFKIIPELMRLPYPVCWFEGDLVGDLVTNFGALCFEANNAITCILFLDRVYPGVRGWMYAGHGRFSCAAGSDELRLQGYPQEASVTETILPLVMTSIASFLTALNCCNVKRVKNNADLKLQKSRKAKGKLPIFEFWTLELEPLLQVRDATGGSCLGTHASPRVHLRRGHARKLESGKYIWVNPHIVGDKGAGIVHKEYAA
jgi:hypothetical protein